MRKIIVLSLLLLFIVGCGKVIPETTDVMEKPVEDTMEDTEMVEDTMKESETTEQLEPDQQETTESLAEVATVEEDIGPDELDDVDFILDI